MKPPKFIDLSHSIEDGMITYRGLPAPVISDFLTREDSRRHYAPETEFSIRKIEMVANTGTYIDSPFHRFADGKDLADLPLTSLAALAGVVVRTSAGRAIGRDAFGNTELAQKAVIVHTGWDRHWRTERYFENHPYLTRDAAEYLVGAGAALVGIDSFNIDSTSDGTRPAHTLLLKNEIPIVEHLCGLQHLPNGGFKFFAVPVKVRRFGTFPVRAFALIDE
jgi:kynurenine formamidase